MAKILKPESNGFPIVLSSNQFLVASPSPAIVSRTIFMAFLYSVDPNDQKKTACYDIDVEVDDTLKTQMNSFLLSTASQQEIAGLDNKVRTEAQLPSAFFPSFNFLNFPLYCRIICPHTNMKKVLESNSLQKRPF